MMDLDKLAENFDKALKNISQEEIDELTEKYEPTPVGWLSIEEYLPMVRLCDIEKNNALFRDFKVRYTDGTEGDSRVGDHNTWYYDAKEAGITHWYNEE